MNAVYRAAMFVGHYWCHQRPERSPHLFGVQFPLCWRCTGILAGVVILFVLLLYRRRLLHFWPSLVLSLLMPLDVLYAIISHGPGDNGRRLITGLLWGAFGTNLQLLILNRASSQVFDHSMLSLVAAFCAAANRKVRAAFQRSPSSACQ